MPPLLRTLCFLPALLATARAEDIGRQFAGYPPPYIEMVRAAMQSFTARDFETAIKQVDKADLLFQVTPVALNIRGAIAIEQKKYDEGRDFCLQALKADPNFYPARFNLCEIPFVQGKYKEARALLRNLLESFPKDDLVKFRIYLTFLLEKDDDAAQQHRDHVPFLSDSPVYYYTQAAWEFAHGNPTAAKGWLTRGNEVFPPVRHQNYIDVFYDLRWLERPGTPKSGE